jgi:L-iditol 2-dehydrogenase
MTGRRALVIAEPGSIALQDVPELVPGPGEVVARPVHTGICGTDLELLAGVVDPAYVRYPLVPGHEWSGVIEAVGPGVTGLEPGQPVIAEGIIPDRVCAECVQGHTNLCVVYDELGFTRAGAAADQVLLPAQVVHMLGGSADLLEAALAAQAGLAAELGATGFTVDTPDTHRFPLEDYAEAYQVLRAGSGPRGKVMLDINQEDAR